MLGFVYDLREAGIPVSVRYILEFYNAIKKGMASDIDSLFLLARLIFIKRVEHYDLFEQVFAYHFMGAPQGLGAPDWDELLAGKPFQEWLREELESGRLSPEELRTFSTEELLAKFWETLLAQDGEHHGGNRWIGTGGRSPYGHGGLQGGGIRVYGRGLHGTAQKVIGDRRYLNYAEDSSLTNENLRQVLTSMKSLRPMGPESELDVDETIARTAKNGGEIEFVFQREMRNRLKLIVMLDNGGYSMDQYFMLVKTVFQRIRDSFKDVSFYYFHNCIYGTVYRDPVRVHPVKWENLVNQGKHTRLAIIGDANMAPMELMASYGSLDIYSNERKPGIEWLQELRAAFPASVWLNPIRKEDWEYQSTTIHRVGRVFQMEDLTLHGIKNAVAYLNAQGQAFDRM
ncbi:MAG: hypothetical protein AB7W37_15380 [Syntrophobacteraceae bacterium]